MFELVIKSVALFYLLQAGFILLASFTATFFMSFLPDALKLRFIATLHLVAFISSVSFSIVVAILSKTGIISMTTNYFIAFMTGSGETGIIIAGWVSLILSLLASYLFIRAGTPPRISISRSQEVFKRLPVIENEKVEFSALFGIFRPFIAISPNLSDDGRTLALIHEYTHAELKHNHIKLFFRMLLRINMFNPLLQRTFQNLDMLCEYECDKKAASQFGKERYIQILLDLISKKHKLIHNSEISGNATTTDPDLANKKHHLIHCLTNRFSSLTDLTGYRINRFRIVMLYTAGIAPILTLTLFIFLSSIPRCAVVCFLGY